MKTFLFTFAVLISPFAMADVTCVALLASSNGMEEQSMATQKQTDGSTTFSFTSRDYVMYATYSPSVDRVSASILERRNGQTTDVDSVKVTGGSIVSVASEITGETAAAISCSHR